MSYSVYPAPVIASKGPLDITWTSLGYNSGDGVNTVTFSSLSSYRFLRLFVHASTIPSGGITSIRFNSDSSQIYTSSMAGHSSGTSQNPDIFRETTALRLTTSTSGMISGIIDISDANQVVPKKMQVNTMWTDSSGFRWETNNFAHYLGTSAISTLSVFNLSNTNNFSNPGASGFYLYGGN